jgi:hypothetical protein
MYEASLYDTTKLLADWHWLVPSGHTPLFISALGDWVMGAPDGSLWVLSVLEGDYFKAAKNAAEYNTLNKSSAWLNKTFIADWLIIAVEHGLNPGKDECLGWKIHPILGGKFKVSNLQVFSMVVYQSIMGQLHRQMQRRQPSPEGR